MSNFIFECFKIRIFKPPGIFFSLYRQIYRSPFFSLLTVCTNNHEKVGNNVINILTSVEVLYEFYEWCIFQYNIMGDKLLLNFGAKFQR